MDKTIQHTPTPWHLDDMEQGIIVADGNGYSIVDCRSGKLDEEDHAANAAFIVRAVNCHEELIETIRWMAQTVHQGNHVEQPGTFRECPKSVCDAAKQAIAKAGTK